VNNGDAFLLKSVLHFLIIKF